MPMNSILARFTSIQSPVHHPMSAFNLLYTSFIVFNLLLSPSLCADPSSCENQICVGTEISYPFGLQGNGCGLPGFQIACEDEVRRVITIGAHNYTLVDVSSNNQSSTIVDDDYFQQCPNTYATFHQITDTSAFRIVEQQNFTLNVFKCNNLCVLGDVSLPYSCDFEPEDVTIAGVIAHWNIENNPLYQTCGSCESSGGWCGYNISNLEQFFCFCGNATHSNQCPGGRTLNRGTTTGIATGTGALITIVALFLVVVYRKRSSSSKGLPTSVATELMNSGSVERVESFLQNYIHQMPTRYSFSQLKKITNNFADKLGEGGFGVVYKGKLRSGFPVAVKLLDQSRQSEKQFMNEVATLGTIHHFHLVRLMGYCFESFRSALVYEYMANGSLEKFIFQEKEKEEQKLSWDQLYSIALGAARGIAYLHEDCSRRIIHFDIKPHNILLDADFTPKIADFGLAKLSGKAQEHVSMTGGRGTAGYAAPEVWSRNCGPVTEKSDVYSFGMLLLEMAGRRRNIDLQVSRSSQLYFPAWAFKLIESGEFEKNLRESGRGREMNMAAEDEGKVRRLTKVGLWCIQHNSIERPSMNSVVQMLEGTGDDVSNPPLPFNSNPPREAQFSSSLQESSSMLHP